MNDKIKVIYLSKRNRTFNYNRRLKGNFLPEKHKNFKINIEKLIRLFILVNQLIFYQD